LKGDVVSDAKPIETGLFCLGNELRDSRRAPREDRRGDA